MKLAWAITIHKSQGASIDFVECNLDGVFEDGQVYVALSRCRTKEGLRITGFGPDKVMANSHVLKFHAEMQQKKTRRAN